MRLLRHLPLFSFLLISYNILAFFTAGETPIFERAIYDWTLASGATIGLTVDMAIVFMGMVAFFIELLKSTKTSTDAIIDHSLSTIVFIVFLLQLILVPETGTWGFLMLTVLSLMDVVAGFTVSITTARRDFSIGA